MTLPTSYLTSVKKLGDFLNAIRGAQAPERFTQSFLESLEFKSSSDRLLITILKALRFLESDGKPTERYYQYLDQTQSEKIMADALREAYEELFKVNTKAHKMNKEEVKQKLRTLTQGAHNDSVLDKMANTFTALVKHADFSSTGKQRQHPIEDQEAEEKGGSNTQDFPPKTTHGGVNFGGLHYNIQIILPPTRDQKIYDSIFKSLKEHLSDG